MRTKKTKMNGKIIVPRGAMPQPHELVVATILAWTGEDVEFIPVATFRTPDIKFRNREWEIKSPKGSSSRTLENNMRLALRQSSNIIIDLHRIKIPEQKCLAVIKTRARKLGHIHRLMAITKSGKIIEFWG